MAEVTGTHPKSRLTRLKRLLASLNQTPRKRYANYMRMFDDAILWKLLRPAMYDSWYRSRDWLMGEYGKLWSNDDVRSALAVDRVTYLPEDLLTKLDRASMLHALEVRNPFMDDELVSFAATLDTQQLIGSGRKSKRMLREAFAGDLPRHVFSRRKMGFAVPIGHWFRTSLRPMLHDLVLDKSSFAMACFEPAVLREMVQQHELKQYDHSERLYALLMLELWWRRR